MTLTEVFAYGMEFIQAVLIPLVMYIGKYFSNFITEFRSQLANIVQTLEQIIDCLINLKENMSSIQDSMDTFTNANQSTIQDMNAMSKLQVSSEIKIDSLGQQLARIEGGLNAR